MNNADIKIVREIFSVSDGMSEFVRLKIRIAELVFSLMSTRKNFGLFIIFGWRHAWDAYADTPDISQDILRHRELNIGSDNTSIEVLSLPMFSSLCLKISWEISGVSAYASHT